MNQNPPRGVNVNRGAPDHADPVRGDPGRAERRRVPQSATAEVPGHLGELVQGRLGPDGPVALITLPCPVLVTRLGYAPARGPLTAGEPVSAKTCAAARLALAELGAEGWGGALTIERPAAPGLGLGSSTAETLGAVRAVAGAFGLRLAPEREAVLCLAAEGAVDPLMWAEPVIFASRGGRVVEPLPALPAMRVVGGSAGPSSPTDPADDAFADLAGVFGEAARALRDGDLVALAAAATRSAEANQARKPNPLWAPVRALGARHGALGVAVSHTGPAIALILAPDSRADPAPGLAALGLDPVLDYRLDP